MERYHDRSDEGTTSNLDGFLVGAQIWASGCAAKGLTSPRAHAKSFWVSGTHPPRCHRLLPLQPNRVHVLQLRTTAGGPRGHYSSTTRTVKTTAGLQGRLEWPSTPNSITKLGRPRQSTREAGTRSHHTASRASCGLVGIPSFGPFLLVSRIRGVASCIP